MDEFPSNRNMGNPKQSEPAKGEKKVKQVVTGEVYVQKKSLLKRFSESFTGDDTQSVFDYVVFDIMIPAGKDMIFDVITGGAQRRLYGTSRPPGRGQRPGGGPNGFVSYQRYSSSPINGQQQGQQRPETQRRDRAINPSEVVIPTRIEAEEVLDQLIGLVADYDMVTVFDFFTMVNYPTDYTKQSYGWTDLRSARVVRTNGGYVIDLPRPEPLR